MTLPYGIIEAHSFCQVARKPRPQFLTRRLSVLSRFPKMKSETIN
jgi:hypothetical protein